MEKRFDPEKVTFFARTDARGKNVPFGIKAKDRQRHVYVIGKTGMGKSTMLENMAVQDIQSGEGVAFIDPHGATAETLLNYVPEDRINDVLYFAPFDMENPVSFNIMEDVGPDKRHLVVSGLMSVFEKIWVDAWSARMAYILQNTLMALLEYPDSTLLGVNRMLSDKNYRNLVVSNLTDPGVKSFWVDEFAKYNERYMQEAGDAIKNKIGQFTANPVIRNIIGQPKSSFDIRDIMDNRKILIMNLSKGLIGETNANLLGSMLTTRIYLAAMSRADLPVEKMRQMPNFYFYVDEFQSFANSTFANILSEARKYHLNLTIAHQYIEQMEEEVRNAVFGNVGTIVSFRVGPFDAEVLETIYAPRFTATDIVNLSFAQIYLTLMIDGIGSQPFSATTLPPIEPPAVSRKDMVIASSRRQFSHNRLEVEQSIQKFHEPIAPPTLPARQTPSGNGSPSSERKDFKPRSAAPQRNTDARPPAPKTEDLKETTPERRPSNAVGTDRPERRNRRERSERQERPQKPKTQTLEELRSVLKNISGSEQTKQTVPAAKKQNVSSDDGVAKKEELKEALTGVLQSKSPQNEPSQVHHQEESQGTPSDSISPKELEKMMRITTSDRPPLR